MQEELLHSVVKLTKTRDVDSLESSLLSTIHEFIGCQKVSIYKSTSGRGELTVECSLSLEVLDDKQYYWEESERILSPSSELLSCLHSACIIAIQDQHGVERRWIPITLSDKPIGAIAIVSESLSSADQVLLNAFCCIYENYLTILHENERDKLTGLLNRQTFDKKLKQLIEKQVVKHHKTIKANKGRKQHEEAMSWLAMLDIDHFKQVNDNYGHVCGDEVLLILAQTMEHFFNPTDLLFRFGGEEFVLVFEPVKFEEIERLLNEFVALVRRTKFPFVDKLTVSIGIAKVGPYDFPIHVLENADRALYAAKESGRDQICFFESIAGDYTRPKGDDDGVDLF
ncbi:MULTISPECIES: GGDEF domain-containing protein [Pseudoalteromonas]|uniref:diguanylate cyclase n=1 Tax=Pseudoalteromonas amylolytica TaxID=1859457 RepID=A0A1S1MRI1_9GAMM|nr:MULTISPECIES: GGDEF domain-containing protein [Pseudoalteromonas]OHU87790.1 diguanylate cyclase [Pseudoalteromonas sp. JW3]OHU91230.1 diguanylate cyclase [Pseudoalteromonas amylolytica]